MIFEKEWSNKTKLLSYSAKSFSFTDIYWMAKFGFFYSSKPISFTSISISFSNFLSQKTYPDEYSRPDVVWNGSYQRKSGI